MRRPTKFEFGDQSRERACCQRAADATDNCRRGDRIVLVSAAVRNVRFWHKADITARLIHVRFWG
jgi:hypothetical protein